MKKEFQQILGYVIGGLLVLGLIPFGIGSAANRLDPVIGFRLCEPGWLRMGLGIACFLPGAVIGIWSIVVQNTVGKGGPVQIGNLDISPRTQELVVSGPYKYTRNPMLFGACMMYLAFSLYLNSVTAAMLVVLFAVFMLCVVVPSEEKRLLKDFGDSYVEYKKRTSLFFPWFSRNPRD